MRWNFSSRARELSDGDAILISVPKSGRTWVRVFLCAYFCKRHGREFTLWPERYQLPEIPRLIYSHDLSEHRMKARFWDRLRGKYLVPAREAARARVILLARDPRDAFVSLYLQLVHRTPETPEKLRQKSAGDLLRDPRHGITSIVKTMNSWLAEFGHRADFILARYEALRAAPEKNFRALLATLGETSPDPAALAYALEFSDFANMQKLEAAGLFDSKILQSGDVRNPESFKVRRGKVGGYRDYLSLEDQAFAAAAMKNLDARFGYTPKSSMRVLCVIEHGNAPSTRLRLRDCIGRYQKMGVEATVLRTRRSSMMHRATVIRQAARHDAVVLFKTLGFTKMELMLLQRANRRIVFDFDDAVMFRGQKHRQPLRGKNFKKFLRTVKRCAAVVAGNDFLACFAEGCGRPAVVLPTSIDLAKYSVKKHAQGKGLTIGWLGLSDGLPYLQHIRPALQTLSGRFPGLKLKVVSDKPLQLEGIAVENEAWRLETEQANLASFDVGIMPLWDSVWTRGKCGYKILQYMAAGTPVVASAVGANTDIITHGENGFLARTQEDWVNSIASLIENAELRRDFGLRGRALVEKFYSLDRFTEGYVALLRGLANGSENEVLPTGGKES
jgi:glycosyltransferase involved in cell wall biosynthesis